MNNPDILIISVILGISFIVIAITQYQCWTYCKKKHRKEWIKIMFGLFQQLPPREFLKKKGTKYYDISLVSVFIFTGGILLLVAMRSLPY